MRISAGKLKLQKRINGGKKEILGLEVSKIKMKNSLNGLNSRLEIAEERIYELDRLLGITNLIKEKKKTEEK